MAIVSFDNLNWTLKFSFTARAGQLSASSTSSRRRPFNHSSPTLLLLALARQPQRPKPAAAKATVRRQQRRRRAPWVWQVPLVSRGMGLRPATAPP